MKKTAIILTSLLVAAGFTSCEKSVAKVRSAKNVVTNSINVDSEFTGISTDCDADIEFTEGNPNIYLSLPANLADQYVVEVKNGTLTISCKEKVQRDRDVKLFISAQGVNYFNTSGSGDIEINSIITGDKLTFVTTGTGDIEADYAVNGTTVILNTSGTGDIDIKSLSTEVLNATTSGTGDIEIKSITANESKLLASGTGDIEIGTGNCGTVNKTSSGTGKIRTPR